MARARSTYRRDGERIGHDDVWLDARELRRAGEEALRAGRLALLSIAGDDAAALPWRGPLGTYPATVVTGKPLFRCLAEQVTAMQRRCGVVVPWCILTSPDNDAATRAYFADNNCFGLVRRNIVMLAAAAAPGLATGSLGWGTAAAALRDSGADEHLAGRGVDLLSVVSVDNPLAKAIDPLFIGLHLLAPDDGPRISSKVLDQPEGDDDSAGMHVMSLEQLVGAEGHPAAAAPLWYQVERREEYAPIRSRSGPHSAAASHQAQSDRAGRWLEAQGTVVPRSAEGHVDAMIEISPLTALEPEDLAHADVPNEIARGAEVVI